MEKSSISEEKYSLLHKVLSPSLDPTKSWFALNSVLCSGKPSRLCSLGFAQVFSDEYRQVELDDLVSDDGVPASASWFSAPCRRSEKVYVASAFGLILGILRQNALQGIPFINSDKFRRMLAWINKFDLRERDEEPHEIQRLKCLTEALQGQLSARSKELLALRAQMSCEKGPLCLVYHQLHQAPQARQNQKARHYPSNTSRQNPRREKGLCWNCEATKTFLLPSRRKKSGRQQ